MSVSAFEDSLRARLRVELDPHIPDRNAERRVLGAVAADAAEHRSPAMLAHGLRPGIVGALVVCLVVALVGGALTVSLALTHQAAPRHVSPAGSGPPIAASPSLHASVSPCDGGVLSARVADQTHGIDITAGDIALTNTGAVPCSLDGYLSLEALANGHVEPLGVAHIAAGTVVNNGGSPLPPALAVTVLPGYEAFAAFEVSTVRTGSSACPKPGALLITPPQGHRYATLSGWSLPLCAEHGVALWIDEAAVSVTDEFAHEGA